MEEKGGMHGLPNFVVAPEAEADVAHASTHAGSREVIFDPTGGADEVDRIIVVFFDSGGHGEDIGVENDVICREFDFLREDVVGPLADGNPAFEAVGLTLFVECHHDDSGAIGPHLRCVFTEFFRPFFEGNGVYDGLALHTLETGFDHTPLGGVDHDGNAGDVGF